LLSAGVLLGYMGSLSLMPREQKMGESGSGSFHGSGEVQKVQVLLGRAIAWAGLGQGGAKGRVHG